MRNGGETNSFVCFRGHCLQICLKYSVLEALYLCPCSLPLACCALRPSCEPYSLRFDALHALCALRFDALHTSCASRLLAPHTPRAPLTPYYTPCEPYSLRFDASHTSCASRLLAPPRGLSRTLARAREFFGHSPSLLMSLCQLLAQDNSPAHRPKNIL